MEISIDTYKQKEEEIEEEVEQSPYALIMDLSYIIPGEIQIEDEIRMGYLRNKYKKSSK